MYCFATIIVFVRFCICTKTRVIKCGSVSVDSVLPISPAQDSRSGCSSTKGNRFPRNGAVQLDFPLIISNVMPTDCGGGCLTHGEGSGFPDSKCSVFLCSF